MSSMWPVQIVYVCKPQYGMLEAYRAIVMTYMSFSFLYLRNADELVTQIPLPESGFLQARCSLILLNRGEVNILSNLELKKERDEYVIPTKQSGDPAAVWKHELERVFLRSEADICCACHQVFRALIY